MLDRKRSISGSWMGGAAFCDDVVGEVQQIAADCLSVVRIVKELNLEASSPDDERQEGAQSRKLRLEVCARY